MTKFRMTKNKEPKDKKLKSKMILLVVLLVVFILDIIYVSFFQRQNSISDSTEYSTEGLTEHTTEVTPFEEETNVPNFGTKVVITNLEEHVVPMLDEKAVLLESCLQDYVKDLDVCVESAEIFHTTIMGEENMKLCFFCRLNDIDEIVMLSYDYETENVLAEKSEFTEEEIVNEIWQGEAPAIRDIEE